MAGLIIFGVFWSAADVIKKCKKNPPESSGLRPQLFVRFLPVRRPHMWPQLECLLPRLFRKVMFMIPWSQWTASYKWNLAWQRLTFLGSHRVASTYRYLAGLSGARLCDHALVTSCLSLVTRTASLIWSTPCGFIACLEARSTWLRWGFHHTILQQGRKVVLFPSLDTYFYV